MSTIRTSAIGPVTGSNTASIVDPGASGAYMSPRVILPYYNMGSGGTSAAFTNIPSWVRRITITCTGFTAGTSGPLVRLGYGSTTYLSSGYTSAVALFGNANNTGINSYTDGFYGVGGTAPNNMCMTLIAVGLPGIHYWHMSGTVSSTQPYGGITNGYVNLGQQLTAIQVSANGGTTFSSGLIQVMYE